MKKTQMPRRLTERELVPVNGGTKTVIAVDDTQPAQGGLRMYINGELVTLYPDGEGGFYCTVNGKEYRFTNAEIAEMLHRQLCG